MEDARTGKRAKLSGTASPERWLSFFERIVEEKERGQAANRASGGGSKIPRKEWDALTRAQTGLSALLREVIPSIVGLETARADAALERALASDDRDLASLVQVAVLGMTWRPGTIATFDPADAARPALLDRLAKQATSGSPILATALGALVIRAGANAPAAVTKVLAAAPPGARAEIREALGEVHVVLGPDPAWIDVFAPDLAKERGAPYHLTAMLGRWRDASLVARALAKPCSDATATELLRMLRRLDDRSIGPRLTTIAADRRGTPMGERIAALAKELGGDVPVGVDVKEEASVGTDGGPIVLVPAAIASQWTGVTPPKGREVRAKSRYDRADADATDYDEACDCSRVALVARAGGAVLVLPEQGAWFGRPKGEAALWCVVAGNRETFAKHGATLKWKALPGAFAVGRGGVIALDAALAAKGRGGNRATLSLAPGTYRVEVAHREDDRGEMHVARLVPEPATRGSRASADRGKSGARDRGRSRG